MTTSDPQLMTIGEFARVTGLTASALRFYADSGLLLPADIDGISGYRRYVPDQVARARLLRRLREIATPLSTAADILDAAPARPLNWSTTTSDNCPRTRRWPGPRCPHHRRSRRFAWRCAGLRTWSVLAAAVDQVLTATVDDRQHTILNTVRIESDCTTGTLTLGHRPCPIGDSHSWPFRTQGTPVGLQRFRSTTCARTWRRSGVARH